MTTTAAPSFPLPEVASKLENGCWVLDARKINEGRQIIVLGFHSGAGAEEPFATWEISAHRPKHTYSGHYFKTIGEAYADFTHRIIERG